MTSSYFRVNGCAREGELKERGATLSIHSLARPLSRASITQISMINFVAALPAELEPNSIYYVEGDGSSASHFVADNEGNAIPISSETLVKAYMATLKGQANGYAELTAESTLPVNQLPEGSRPAAITDAITLVQNALQSNINAKADASAVYDRSQVDSIESALQSQIDAKQGGLANAADVAKIGDATFDGKPIILLTATEW